MNKKNPLLAFKDFLFESCSGLFVPLQKMKELKLDEWKNIRGPRPWEDSRDYQEQQRSRQNKQSWAPRTNGAELMAVGGASGSSGSSQNRLCFVLDQVLLACGSFGLFVPKHHLLPADCPLWPSDDCYLRKQPVGGASVSCIASPFWNTIFINLWIQCLNKFCVIDPICLVCFF